MVVRCVGGTVLRKDALIISKEILDFEEQLHAHVVEDCVHNAPVSVRLNRVRVSKCQSAV